MTKIVALNTPDDFIIATGIAYTIEKFVSVAFACVGITDWQNYVEFDERFVRPNEVRRLSGSSIKLHRTTGWYAKTTFQDLVKIMIEAEQGQIPIKVPKDLSGLETSGMKVLGKLGL